MATLVFRVSSDWEQVVRLREEIKKLETQLRNFGKSTPEQEVRKLETQLASTKQQMMGLVTEAAKAGAAMENDLKRKIDSVTKSSDELSEEIIKQRSIIRETREDVRLLSEQYSKMDKNSASGAATLSRLKKAKAALVEQRYSMGELQDQQARNRLELRQLNREYKELAKNAGSATGGMDLLSSSLQRTVAEIGGLMAIRQFTTGVIEATGKMQQLQVALSTILQDEGKAAALIQEITQFAAKTPFNLDEVAAGAKQLLAYGSTAENVVDELSMLGDVASGLQIPIGQLIYLYGTLRTQGRAMTVDIRQFAGRGIPIYEELARVLGVAKDQVGELVTAGKVGFKEVEQAFKNMTSEGGKFNDLMENSAGTWPQRISNIQDTLFQKLNDFGNKYKEVFEAGIGTVEELVESLDDVIAIIGSVVAAYGTYRAALLAVAAAQKAQAFVENIRLIAMFRKELGLATAAQQAFNAASKANVYAAVLSAVVALGTAMYMLTKRTDKATEASAKLAANIKTETNELDDLFDRLKKAKEGTDERRTAIEDINSKYGSYLSNLLTEKSTVEDISEAYQEAKKSIIDYNIEKARSEYLKEPFEGVNKFTQRFYKSASVFSKELSNETQRGRFQAYLDKIIDDLKNGGTFNVEQIYNAFRAAQANGSYATVDDWLKAYRSGVEDYGLSNTEIISKVGGLDISDFEYSANTLGTYFKSLSKATEEFESFSKAYTETFDNSTKTEETKKDLQTLGQLVETIKKAEDNLKSLRSQSQQGLIETAKVKEAEKELSALTDKYKSMTGEQYGETPKKIKPKENQEGKDRLKAEQEFGRLLIGMVKQRWQSELELEEDGEKKRLEQIKADYEARKKQIEDGAKELAVANKKNNLAGLNADGLTDEQAAKVDAANAANEKIRSNEEDIIRREKLKKEQDAYNEYLRLYGEYQDRRLAITKEYEQKIAEAGGEDTWQGKLLAKERDNAISDINLDELKGKINWELIFSDLSKVSKENLDKVKKQLREFKDSDEYKSMAVDQKQVVDEALDKINSTLIDNGGLLGDLPHQLDLLRQAQEELNKAQEEYNKALESGTDAEKEQAQGKLNAAQNKLDVQQGNVSKATDKTVRNFTVLSDAITQLGSSSELSLSQIGGLAEGITNIFTESGSKIGGIVGTAMSLLDAIGKQGLDGFIGNVFDSVFNAVHGIWDGLFGWTGIDFGGESIPDLAEKLENLTQSNEDLNTAIDNLSEKMEEASVSESTELYEQQKRNIEQMMANTQQQMVYSGSAYSNGFLGIGGDHSSNYEINDSMSADEWRAISNIVGRTIGSASDFWNLTSEEMYKVATQATTIYSKIKELADDGHANAAQFMDTYIQYWKQLEEIENAYREKLTSTSFDSIKNDFRSALLDMENSAEAFADNFEEMMKKAILEAMMTDLYDDRLQDWYKEFAGYMENYDKMYDAERQEMQYYLQQWYNSIVEDAKNDWQETIDTMGWNSDAREQQTASRGGFETMSQDQASELSGRFTAVAETGIRIEGAITELRGDLSGLLAQSQGIYNIANDTRNILAQSYLELQQINENTEISATYLKTIKDDISVVKQNTSRL